MLSKKMLKNILGFVLKRTYFEYCLPRNANLILLYHRVLPSLPSGFYEPGLVVRASTLAMHLEQVRKLYEIVPLLTLTQNMNKKNGLCAITFDDGWIDTYEIAFPILKRLKVPATVFLSTGLIGKKNPFWFDNLITLANVMIEKKSQSDFIQYFNRLFPSWNPETLTNNCIGSLIAHMKSLPSNSLEGIISAAYCIMGIKNGHAQAIISWEHISEMERSGITFAPHGSNHFILPTLNRDVKREEILTPLQMLYEKGVHAIPIFSYPNGTWDEESMTLVAKGGYEGAVTTRLGYVGKRTNPFLLNRIDIHESSSNTHSMFWFRIFQSIIAGQESGLKASLNRT